MKKSKTYQLLMYVADGTPTFKKFETTKEMGKFMDDFNKQHPDYASGDSGWWLDYAVTEVSGDIHLFTNGIEIE